MLYTYIDIVHVVTDLMEFNFYHNNFLFAYYFISVHKDIQQTYDIDLFRKSITYFMA